MQEIFKNIDIEKRDRIINSALEEFSKNRFDKASTNNIVKNANISKGLLFHYFANKKELYGKLEEFVIQTVSDAIIDNVDWNVTDFFERVKQIVMIKGDVTYKYPYIYDFTSIMLEEKSVEELKKHAEKLSPDLMKKVYTYNIDFSLFKENIDIERTMNIIRWTFEKFGEELVKDTINADKAFDYKKIEKEIEKYIEVLKKAFYK